MTIKTVVEWDNTQAGRINYSNGSSSITMDFTSVNVIFTDLGILANVDKSYSNVSAKFFDNQTVIGANVQLGNSTYLVERFWLDQAAAEKWIAWANSVGAISTTISTV